MNQSIDRLNELPLDLAQVEFLKCCGSRRWAEAMATARPFSDAQAVFAEADALLGQLGEQDWLEAFRAHPKIGERKAETAQSEQAQKWSAHEQARLANASGRIIDELAEKNRQYEDRFGFIFIVCATGKSSEEILAILSERLQNKATDELQAAAQEQAKITRLRLEKLLSS